MPYGEAVLFRGKLSLSYGLNYCFCFSGLGVWGEIAQAPFFGSRQVLLFKFWGPGLGSLE